MSLPSGLSSSSDAYIALIHALYVELKVYPQPPQYTVLAAFYLTVDDGIESRHRCKIVSLGTGTKCLPQCRLTLQGERLHDSHAEVLARRGAVRWFLEEILRERIQRSPWIESYRSEQDSKLYYRLKDNVHLEMYISTVPCGDASTRFLAAFQDPEMAALKDTPASISIQLEATTLSTLRGRNGYHVHNVLRTKPGRSDSPPTLSLSCSDKIASWAWFGVLGTLGARFFGPGGVYARKIVIGEVYMATTDKIDLRDAIKEDCERALGGRLEGLLPDTNVSGSDFALQKPIIEFTSIPFIHSRFAIGVCAQNLSSNDSLCWRADSLPPPSEPTASMTSTTSRNEGGTAQVLINGYKRGVSPKQRQKLNDDKFLPHLCKLSMFRLYARICKEIHGEIITSTRSYYDVKTASSPFPRSASLIANPTSFHIPRTVRAYHDAKIRLKGPSGPFSAWWAPEHRHVREQEEKLTPNDVDSIKDGDPMAGEGPRNLESIGEVKKGGGHPRGEGWWEGFNINGEVLNKTDVGNTR